MNDIILEGAPSTIIEVIRQQVEELSQVVRTDQFAIDGFRNLMIDLQKKCNATLQRTGGSSVLPSSDSSLQTSDTQMNKIEAKISEGLRNTDSWQRNMTVFNPT